MDALIALGCILMTWLLIIVMCVIAYKATR